MKSRYPIDKRYKLLSILGEGIHGVVYKAHDYENNELVAIKEGNVKDISHEVNILWKLKKNIRESIRFF